MVAALTDGRAGELDERGVGVSCPGLEGYGEDEGAAVEEVLAALPGDQRVEGGKRASLAGQGEDVDGGAFPVQCPAGSRVSPARPGGALVWCPDSDWSSRPRVSPMQLATVAAWPSGDSGWAWSRTTAASAVSLFAEARGGTACRREHM
jgi:hypothetical protein